MALVQGSAPRHCGLQRRRPRLAPLRDARPGCVAEGARCHRAATTKPFNVNFFCHTQPEPESGREMAWRALLAPYFAELRHRCRRHSRRPRTRALQRRRRRRAGRIRAAGRELPFRSAVARAARARASAGARRCCRRRRPSRKRAGSRRVASTRSSRKDSRRAAIAASSCPEDLGTQVGTFALVPQIVQAVKIPVIAAGGIADANGVAAAMALGAAGVQVGTAYLLCPEATTSAVHRAALAERRGRATRRSRTSSPDGPARGIVNRLMRELGPINAAVPAFPLAAAALALLRAKAESQGCGDFSPMWAGQNTSGCEGGVGGGAHARAGQREMTRACFSERNRAHEDLDATRWPSQIVAFGFAAAVLTRSPSIGRARLPIGLESSQRG